MYDQGRRWVELGDFSFKTYQGRISCPVSTFLFLIDGFPSPKSPGATHQLINIPELDKIDEGKHQNIQERGSP